MSLLPSGWTSRLGWVGTVVRLALAAILAWAGAEKLSDPRAFTRAVRAYDATPEWLTQAIGYGLPVLELSIALLLAIGLITRYVAIVAAALFTFFGIGLVQAAARGIKLECGCFGGGGPSAHTSYTLDILRDAGLLILAVFLILWPMTRMSLDEWIIKSEHVPGLSAKQARVDKNQRRYRAAVAAAEQELKHKQRFITLGATIAVILISLIGIGVQSGRAKVADTVNTANATVTTGVQVGNHNAPVIVDVYEDFQCPICNDLEQSGMTKSLSDKITATNIRVNYHVMSFLDGLSNGNKYSSRAANAGYCASDSSADAFLKFHDIAFGKNDKGVNNQPAENSNGVPDSTLMDWGKQAGITTADFTTCVATNQHKDLVAAVTDQASKKGINSTPTVYVDGAAVKAVAGKPLTSADVDAAIATALTKHTSTVAPASTPAATDSAAATSSAASVAPTSSVPPAASSSATGSGSASGLASASKSP